MSMFLRYKALLIALLLASTAQAQIIAKRADTTVQVQDYNLDIIRRFKIPTATDTAHALLGRDSLGLLVYVRADNKIYYRDTSAGRHKWTLLGSGGTGSTQRFGVSGEDDIAAQNRTFSASGHNFLINSAGNFSFNSISGDTNATISADAASAQVITTIADLTNSSTTYHRPESIQMISPFISLNSPIVNLAAIPIGVPVTHIALDGSDNIIRDTTTTGGSTDTTSLSDRINSKVTNAGGAPSILEDVLANRPVSSTTGALFYATDPKVWYRWNGSAWDPVTVIDGAITNAKLATMAAHTYKGNSTGSTATPSDVTATQLTADLDIFTSTLKGLAPSSGGGTTNYLRADGTWAAPPGSGGTQTLQQTLDQGSTLNKSNTVAYAGFTQNFTGGLTKFDSIRLGVIAAPLTKIGTLNGLGDSFRQPATGSTAPVDSSELAMLADTLRVQYNNLALSGSGVRYAIGQMDSTISGPFNSGITWVQAGYNDARAGGNGAKTPLKIASALKAGFVNHFADEYITGSDTTTAFIHRYGTWTTGLNSTTMGGKTKNGAQTSTLNDSITYDFVGRYAGVILKGGDGSAYITSIVRANIDYGSTTDYNTTVADGTTVVSKVNNEIPYAIVFDAGTWGKHHIKLVNTEAKIMYVDYFAPLTIGVRGPYIVNHMIYPVASAGTQYLACNNAIDSAWALLPSAFPTWVVPVNTNFDRTTGLSGDGVHPNNTGYKQIFRAEMDQWNARAVGLQGALVRDTTGLYFFDRGYHRLLEAREAFTRSEAAYKFPSYVEIPANMAYRVGGVDIWKADVTNKNYLIGNQVGVAMTYGSATNNILAGDLAGTGCTTCSSNVGIGSGVMQLTTTATDNAAFGAFSMQQNTTGGQNTALGKNSLKATATGSNNVGIGWSTLILNTASNNTGIGASAGAVVTSGSGNTYAGYQSGNFNATSNFNAGLGYQSVYGCTGAQNTGAGAFTLAFQTSGVGNSAVGYQAGYGNAVNGAFNYSVFHGYAAGKQNGAGGDFNIYIGDSTGVTASGTTFTGKRNIIIGNADTALNSSINDYINIGHTIFGDRATGRVSIKTNSVSNTYFALPASTTSYSSLNIPSGAAPSSPNHGDAWTDANHFYMRLNGVTQQIDQQSGGSNPFSDATALVKNNSDNTKLFRILASSITTGTQRDWTVPNYNGTFARIDGSQTFTGDQTYSNDIVLSSPGGSGINDSTVTWDPVTKKLRVSGRIVNFTAKNGLQLRSSDSAIIEGGAYDQDTYIGGGGFSKYEGTAGSTLDTFRVNADHIVFSKTPVNAAGSPFVVGYAWTTVSSGNTSFATGGTTADEDATYEACGWLNINSISVNQIKFTITFTDLTNTTRTLDLFPSGSTTALQTTTGYKLYCPVLFKAKSGTNLDFAVTGTSGGSMNYDYEFTWKKIHP